MITKYLTSSYRNEITTVQIVRETEKCVFIPRSGPIGGERRESKRSEFYSYFSTWEKAHEYLLNRATTKLKYAIKRKVEAEDELRQMQQMQPPTCSPTSE